MIHLYYFTAFFVCYLLVWRRRPFSFFLIRRKRVGDARLAISHSAKNIQSCFSVESFPALKICVEKNPVTASIIAISLNAAVTYLRYQYCLVSVETDSTLHVRCWNMAGRQQQKQSTSKCAPSMGSTQLC